MRFKASTPSIVTELHWNDERICGTKNSCQHLFAPPTIPNGSQLEMPPNDSFPVGISQMRLSASFQDRVLVKCSKTAVTNSYWFAFARMLCHGLHACSFVDNDELIASRPEFCMIGVVHSTWWYTFLSSSVAILVDNCWLSRNNLGDVDILHFKPACIHDKLTSYQGITKKK